MNFIDKAMDAAESVIAEKEVIQESTSNEADIQPQKEDIAETQAIAEKISKPKNNYTKDDKGRFTKADKQPPSLKQISSDQTASAETEVKIAEPKLEQSSTIPAPANWSTERKAVYSTASPELQKVITERELEFQQLYSRLANENQQIREEHNRLYDGWDALKDQAELHGMKSPVDELNRYRAWDKIFKSSPREGIMDLMRKNGFIPYDFIQGYEEPQNQTDPEVEQLKKDLEEHKKFIESQKQEVEVRKQQEQFSIVDTFKKGKDSQGNVRESFVSLYAPQISQAAEVILKDYPQLNLSQALEHAYEYVLDEARKAHNVQSPTPQPAQVPSKRALEAASSVSGAPVNGVAPRKPKAKTIDEAMDRAEEITGMRL